MKEKMKRMKEKCFFQKMFENAQIRQMNQPKMFRKNPRRTNYSSIFPSKVQNLAIFELFT